MYIPLPLRLTLFFTLLLGVALLFFGNMVYAQAEQRAYRDLDNALSSRAASVRLGKFLDCPGANPNPSSSPATLPSVDGLGTGGIAIEVLDDKLHLLATTSNLNPNDFTQASVDSLVPSPVPWDGRAAHMLLQQYSNGATSSMYSTITYQGQHVRVYSTISTSCSTHLIQTARSEQDIEQSLTDLRSLLIRGGALVLAFAFAGGWLMTWGILAVVRRITRTASSITTSRDFSQRVPSMALAGRDELVTLAATFNEMLASLQELQS